MLLKDLSEEFKFNCQCRRLSAKTTSNYQKQISYLLNFLEEEYHITQLEDVRPQQIRKFLLIMQQKGRKPQYINDLLKAFKCFFKYLQQEEYTKELITDKIHNVKQPKVIIQTFSNEEVKRMINYYSGYDYLNTRNKTIMCMFFDTGIRLNELITLTDEQVHADYILIHGKGDKERVVPKSPYLSKWLFKYKNVRNSYFEYRAIKYHNVFLSKNGRPLTSEAIERLVKIAGAACDVNKNIRCSPHTCRHTFAQMQLKNGLDIYALSRLMGHENISITQRYLEGLKDREVLTAGTKTSPLMNL
ncbi:MAG: tyrosine-type recombinase/integrase [Oscillospiraceae bacterium]|jgi:integrase/recombinase XerD|nr:tyrosine-type recombinase/integrase [Oscillospiraceae bacterium]MCI2190752.1 tyrosine-type recombinase/integrase [Oscillospiraceae bacterium]MCI2206542.1 tyrosine-type recombinase/integrase [Oscillospiraceae bacterium]